MAATSEHDPRLGAPAGLRLAPAPLGGAPLEAPEPTLVYYDVPGESLTAAGIALRRRSEDGGAHWRLRLPAGYSCLELEAEGGWAQPPAELLALLQAHLRRGPLEPIVEVRTRESNDVELKIELRDRGSAEI